MPKRVLIVGETPILGRELGHREEREWSFDCVRAGLEALAALHQVEYCAVVANERLPGGITGSALLNEVLQRQPRCLRFLRSDLQDKRSTFRNIGTTHHLLVQPTDFEALKNAVEQAQALELWLPVDKVQGLLTRLHQLPSPPNLYFEVSRQLQSPTASLDDIGQTISRDPAMSAKLLQLVNSAVFGLQLQVGHPSEAVGFLGLETTKSLILLAHAFSHFDALGLRGFSVESLWQHSLMTARVAESIASLEAGSSNVPAQAFTAGLLHDIGQLLLAANLPADFQKAVQWSLDERIELWQAEASVFGTHHAEIGACLLAIWGLPNPIIEAVGLHHRPIRLSPGEFTPLTAVHTANVWARSVDPDCAQAAPPHLDTDYLLSCGCADRVSEWKCVVSARAEPAGLAVGS